MNQNITCIRKSTLLCFAVWLTSLAAAQAQNYVIDWYTIDGGGGTSTGGVYALIGTIGQPDAGTSSDGNYTLSGGFWPGIVVPSTNAPTLFIQLSGSGATISWSPKMPGFSLEMTDNLTTPSWSPALPGNPVVIPVTSSTTFYRLKKP